MIESAASSMGRVRRRLRSRSALIHELDQIEMKHQLELARTKPRSSILQPITAKKVVRRQVAAVQREIANIERYEYGSYTKGVAAWRDKWEANPDKRVLMFARKDFSGSLFRWAHAVNDFSPWAARLAVLERHPYGYSNDLVFPLPEFAESELDRLLGGATVIHLKDENGFFDGSLRLPEDFFSRHDKPMVFTHYGGFARSLEQHKEYREFVTSFDARIAMTPDLLFPWFEGEYVPHAIDTRGVDVQWTPGRLLCHSPSNPERKGTDNLVEAVDRLNSEMEIQFDLIHGVSFAESVERKKKASLFFDQAGQESKASLGVSTVIGWYGNSALEAAVYGIPTMAHMSQEALERAAHARGEIMERLALLNVGLRVEDMVDDLRRFFLLSDSEQQRISAATRQWVEDFHSFQSCSDELVQIYEKISTVGLT